jgi:hypothetical protein
VARLCSTAAFLCAICVSTAQAEGRSDLDGVWLYVDSETPAELNLTPAGLAKMQAYVPLTDDSDNYCIPASFTNIMHTPSPPFEIRLRADAVEIDYEFLDVRRRIPLRLPGDPAFALDDAPHSVPAYPHLGRSLARFDGETLVVETADVGDGYLDTLGVPGLPQSSRMRTEERFVADGDRLEIIVTHSDPPNYRRDLVVRYNFHRLDSKLMPWDCEPEAASYDRYLERQNARPE